MPVMLVAGSSRYWRCSLAASAAAYAETIYQWPAFQRWYQAAQEEQLA